MYAVKSLPVQTGTTINSFVVRVSSIQPEPEQFRYNLHLAQHAKLTTAAKVVSVFQLDKTVVIVTCLDLKWVCHTSIVFTQTVLQICFAITKTLIVSKVTITNTGKKWNVEGKIHSCNEAEMQRHIFYQ